MSSRWSRWRNVSSTWFVMSRAGATAPRPWPRLWLRAAQGWVYWEIFVILAGALVAIPLFYSAMDFGFGS